MNTVEIIKELCKKNKIPVSKLEKECGFANGYISQLKKDSIPLNRAIMIANYLDVPLNVLADIPECDFTYAAKIDELTQPEYLLLITYRDLNEVGKDLIAKIASAFAGSSVYKK